VQRVHLRLPKQDCATENKREPIPKHVPRGTETVKFCHMFCETNNRVVLTVKDGIRAGGLVYAEVALTFPALTPSSSGRFASDLTATLAAELLCASLSARFAAL
jgi:hypothetical protein